MAKLEIEVKVTEIEVMKELIYMCIEYYLEMPEEMRVKYDEWQDKLEVK